MCFSAGASFGSAIALTVIGIFSLRKVHKKSLYGIAFVPILFAIQQAIEGMVWLALQGRMPSDMLFVWIYSYLFFALIIWPVWIPTAVWYVERNPNRRAALTLLSLFGALASVCFGYELLSHGATADIIGHHVHYHFILPFHGNSVPLMFFYGLPIMGSLLINSLRYMRLFGVLVTFSALFTAYVWSTWFTSIWCFFAALISLGVWYVVGKNQH